MKNFRFACILLALSLAVAIPMPWPAMSTSRNRLAADGVQEASSSEALSNSTQEEVAEPQAAATIIRTIVYRQISDFQSGGSVGSISNLKMSADGSKIIFLSGKKVFTIDATGQNLREVFDVGNPATDPGPSWLDISANGSKVLWAAFNASEIFVANSDGSNRVRLAPTFQNRFGTEPLIQGNLSPRITADGSRVYFTHMGSTTDIAGGYRINADGTGLTQLFSYRQMAQLFGIDGSRYTGDCRHRAFVNTLAISDNGSRLVFGTTSFSSDRNVLAFDSATGLRKLTDFLAGTYEQGLAISGDGSKVVVIRTFPDHTSAVAMNFDGSNQIENSRLTGDGPQLEGMTTSGAQVLANFPERGGRLPLINTDGSGRVDLLVIECDVEPFRRAGLGPTSALSADGRRFAFKTEPAGLPQQIWVADINPSSVGDAPAVSEVNFNPSFVLADRSTSSTFTLRASGGQGGLRRLACGASLKNGVFQHRDAVGNPTLYDDGTHGDQTANDGLYTNNQVTADTFHPPVPVNTLEIRTNVIANSLRQVTAVDATPFFVLTQAPSGSGPHIDSITPSSGQAGAQATITGSGFDPVAGNNIVIFGNRLAPVVSVNSSGTQLVVIVPPNLSPGTVQVTVSAQGQTSNAVTFVVLGGGGGARWEVRLFNIDDVGTVSVNGTPVVQATFGQDTGPVDITGFLQAGLNNVTFTLDNNPVGSPFIYSYGFDVYRDGVLYFREQCGIFNAFGCNNNDLTLGRVYTRTITIRQ